jgi:DNA polymerase III epsilon subunit-like protein
MLSLDGNTLTVFDVETTGDEPGFHEIIQLAIVPDGHRPFHCMVRPEFPERAVPEAMAAHGIPMDTLLTAPSKEDVLEALEEWYVGLRLPMTRRLATLCQNAAFDVPFMKSFMGTKQYDRMFTRHVRDSMCLALGINDAAAIAGEPLPFGYVGLKPLCQHFGIDIGQHHDALADCVATRKVYQELLRMMSP